MGKVCNDWPPFTEAWQESFESFYKAQSDALAELANHGNLANRTAPVTPRYCKRCGHKLRWITNGTGDYNEQNGKPEYVHKLVCPNTLDGFRSCLSGYSTTRPAAEIVDTNPLCPEGV